MTISFINENNELPKVTQYSKSAPKDNMQQKQWLNLTVGTSGVIPVCGV